MDEIKRATKELSPKEKVRVEKFNEIVDELKKKGYKRRDLTISLKTANTQGMLFPLPFAVLYLILNFLVLRNPWKGYNGIIFILLVVGLIVVHEIIHGITWAIFAKHHFKDIEFGFVAKEITPYCYCRSSLKKYQYITGSIMPFLTLGIIISTVALFIPNNATLLLVGIIMMFGAGGDLSIIYLLLKNKSKSKDVLYMDHPVDCGVVMFEK